MFSTKTIKKEALDQVYSTDQCAIYQCDSSSKFYAYIFGSGVEFDICSLIAFRKKLQDVNLEALLLESETAPLEVIHTACIDRLFVLTIEEMIELRDLLEGAFAMLHLNSILHQTIRRPMAS